jgi:hypothetical protein
MNPTGSLPQDVSADARVRGDRVPICVIRNMLLLLNGRGAARLGRPGDEYSKALPLREVVADADWPRVARHDEIGVVAVANDITERVRGDARFNYLAFSDGLTGLANRTLPFDRLRQLLLASRRTEVGFALPALRRTQAKYGAGIGRASPIAASTKAGRGAPTSSLRCCP